MDPFLKTLLVNTMKELSNNYQTIKETGEKMERDVVALRKSLKKVRGFVDSILERD